MTGHPVGAESLKVGGKWFWNVDGSWLTNRKYLNILPQLLGKVMGLGTQGLGGWCRTLDAGLEGYSSALLPVLYCLLSWSWHEWVISSFCYTLSCNRTPSLVWGLPFLKPWAKVNSSLLKLLLLCILPQPGGKPLTQLSFVHYKWCLDTRENLDRRGALHDDEGKN